MTTEQIPPADEDLAMWMKALVKLVQILILKKKPKKKKKHLSSHAVRFW